MPPDKRSFYWNKVQSDPTFKGAVFRSLTMSLYANQIRPTNERFKICKEVFLNIPVVIYSLKDFYLLHEMNEEIENLKSSGLIEYYNFEYVDKKFLKIEEVKAPSNLKFEHLLGSFELLLCGLLLGFLAFGVECLLCLSNNQK